MALLDNGAQVNTITPRYVSDHSLQVGPITDLMGSKVACVGLGNAYTRLLGQVVNVMREVEMDALAMPWANARAAHLLLVHRMMPMEVGDGQEETLDRSDDDQLMYRPKRQKPYSPSLPI